MSAPTGRSTPRDLGVELILASTSPARRALMDSLGVRYRVESPGVDEHVPDTLPAREAVRVLAERKARAVSERFPHALVIGADQMATLDGEKLGKPEDETAARAQLRKLRGRTHELVTGVCVLRGAPEHLGSGVEVASLTMSALDDDALERYLALGEWRGCAGGYRIEAAGQALFARVIGDRTGIQGLPMTLLRELLGAAGVRALCCSGASVSAVRPD